MFVLQFKFLRRPHRNNTTQGIDLLGIFAPTNWELRFLVCNSAVLIFKIRVKLIQQTKTFLIDLGNTINPVPRWHIPIRRSFLKPPPGTSGLCILVPVVIVVIHDSVIKCIFRKLVKIFVVGAKRMCLEHNVSRIEQAWISWFNEHLVPKLKLLM